MKTVNLIANIICGIIFSSFGFILIFKREKIVKALILSNKVFWENIGFTPDEKKGMFITNIMIPIMGAIFLVVGLVLIYRIVIHFLK